jgi:hypothetical protein
VLDRTGPGRIPNTVYSLYLDASGTHGASPVYILAGIAVHEQDAHRLQEQFARPLNRLPGAADPRDYELHATEMVTPPAGTIWHDVPVNTRFQILRGAYQALATYRAVSANEQHAFFGAVVERSYADYQERAWDEVLHRFDEMLTRRGNEAGEPHQRGIVIHDRHAGERTVQDWAARWRLLESRIGVLTHLVDVPFFADSKASRLLQAADFVAFALWRYYGLPTADPRAVTDLWRRFDHADGKMHGLVHVSRSFPAGQCACPPCVSRAAA